MTLSHMPVRVVSHAKHVHRDEVVSAKDIQLNQPKEEKMDCSENCEAAHRLGQLKNCFQRSNNESGGGTLMSFGNPSARSATVTSAIKGME